MPKRFPLPTVTRRQVSTAMVVLVLLLGVVHLTQRMAQTPPDPIQAALQDFRTTCMKAARNANGGSGDLVMDDATEAKIGAYCGCVSEAVAGNVPPAEIARIGQGTASETTMKLLDRIVDGCKPKLQ